MKCRSMLMQIFIFSFLIGVTSVAGDWDPQRAQSFQAPSFTLSQRFSQLPQIPQISQYPGAYQAYPMASAPLIMNHGQAPEPGLQLQQYYQTTSPQPIYPAIQTPEPALSTPPDSQSEYAAQFRAGTPSVPAPLKPPSFKPLTKKQTEDLFSLAKSADGSVDGENALLEVVKRIYWGASENLFKNVDELVAIDKIRQNCNRTHGYYYWHLIVVTNGLSKYPELEAKIKLSAEKGVSMSQNIYGLLLANKKAIVGSWIDQAKEQWQSAAEQDFAPAITNLGLQAKKSANVEEAARLFQKAAELGHLPAMYELSRLLWKGRGIVKDNLASIVWAFRSMQIGTSIDDENSGNFMMGSIFGIRGRVGRDEGWTLADRLGQIANAIKYVEMFLANEQVAHALNTNLKAQYLAKQYEEVKQNYATWLAAVKNVAVSLRSIEPGFCVDCITTETENYDNRNFAKYFMHFEEIVRTNSVMCVGEKNIAVADQVEDLRPLLKKLTFSISRMIATLKEKETFFGMQGELLEMKFIGFENLAADSEN